MIHEKLPSQMTKMSLRNVEAAFAALLLAFATPTLAQETCPNPGDATNVDDRAMAHIRYLADDRLEGREVGTRGARCAADYIAAQFREMGLEPAGGDDSFFQTFRLRKGSELGNANALVIGGTQYAVGSDWTPLGFSANGRLERELVYGGHGLSQPGNPDDRYAHIDLSGKIVVLEWGDPVDAHGVSTRGTPHAKATIIEGRGAAGVLVLAPEGMPLPSLEAEYRAALGVPVAVVSNDVADAIRAAANESSTANVVTDVRPTSMEARNVVALLPGSDPELRDEYVIVGAHYDHLGFGGDGSLAPDSRDVHNGADDNASGTAAVIEIARALAAGPRPDRSVLFMTFTGEEKGLWGSAYWVMEPTLAIDDLVAMLNLDMVGRMSEDNVTVFGFGTAEEWDEIMDLAIADMRRPLQVARAPDGYGASDHTSFYVEGIPVLHFFTNTHADYHRPSDDWQRINADGLHRVAELTALVTAHLTAGETQAVPMTLLEQGPPSASEGPSSTSGYGDAYLGTVPDMTPRDSGMRLNGVTAGSPADLGGLLAGDVVVELNGMPVGDLYEYTDALRSTKPDDVVDIIVERDGERLTLTVTMGRRN